MVFDFFPAMMRPGLAYVVNSLNPGGAEKLAVEMALAFSDEFRVCVFCLDEPGLWAERLRSSGIPVHCLWREPGMDLRMPMRLARGFRASRVNVVHAHQCTAWFYAALARLLYSAPRLLIEEHGRFHPEEDRPLRRLCNRALIAKLTHRFVAVSEDIRDRLERYEGLDARRIQVIYNGVAPPCRLSTDVRIARRREFGFGEDDFVVGTVGRFDRIKNLPMLIDAIGESRDRDPRIRGLLIGDGPEAPSIRSLIEKRGLKTFVRLAGFRDDARTLVQCLDLFVLSSVSEGTSMALLEAVGARIPVAVTAVGGNPEIVVRDETGWLVESGATESLAQTILDAVGHPERSGEFAAAGLRRFEERFTFGRMITGYRRLYNELLHDYGPLHADVGS